MVVFSCDSAAPDATEVNLMFLPEAPMACLAPSIRGGCVASRGVADDPPAAPAVRHGRRNPLPQRLPGDEQVLADVGEPVGAGVAHVAVGVVGDGRDAGVPGVLP